MLSFGRVGIPVAVLALSLMPSLPARALERSPHVETLGHSDIWLRLLHYKRGFFEGQGSRVDAGEFFFSTVGHEDPVAELIATAEAFSKDLKVGKLKQHPQCAFPERYRFLKKELGLQVADVRCPKLEEFMGRFRAQSATLVFSSAYPNNPGSMFGHTFIRINSKNPEGDQKKLDLLDQGVSYAAWVKPGDGGFKFASYGLFGGYWGMFSVLPYYVKVNEYNHAESRDVWEYDLALNEAETLRLLRHAWELETNALFKYYFFDENCAFMLLALIEVAKPEWRILDLPVYVIPGETVKKVMAVPGAVTRVHFRPSLQKKMMARYEALSAGQRNVLFALKTGSLSATEVTDPQVLEAAISYYYYTKQRAGDRFTDQDVGRLQALLAQRSLLGQIAVKEKDIIEVRSDDRIQRGTRPDLAHNTYRLGTAGGWQSRSREGEGAKYFQELDFKFAYHDLMDNDDGYTRWTHIDFPGFVLRYTAGRQKLNIERLRAISITSLSPFNLLEKPHSWKLDVSYASPKDLACVDCHVISAQGGIGLTFEVFSRYSIVYSLAQLGIEAGSVLQRGYRFGPKLENGWIVSPWSSYKFRLGWTLSTDVLQPYRQWGHHVFDAEQSISLSRAWGIRAGYSFYLPAGERTSLYREGKLTLNSYF